MRKFSIRECQIIWLKDAKITSKDKRAIKKELANMTDSIANAVNYLKKRSKVEQRIFTMVRLCMEPVDREREEHSYVVDIWEAGDDWEVYINKMIDPIESQKWVGNIISEKWRLTTAYKDEIYESPEMI